MAAQRRAALGSAEKREVQESHECCSRAHGDRHSRVPGHEAERMLFQLLLAGALTDRADMPAQLADPWA